ncbi:hypothetical protein L1887_30521 [Cichorium endivia]|nr:hypothetical protein L1887_30521 [Cichorium endivia]
MLKIELKKVEKVKFETSVVSPVVIDARKQRSRNKLLILRPRFKPHNVDNNQVQFTFIDQWNRTRLIIIHR